MGTRSIYDSLLRGRSLDTTVSGLFLLWAINYNDIPFFKMPTKKLKKIIQGHFAYAPRICSSLLGLTFYLCVNKHQM